MSNCTTLLYSLIMGLDKEEKTAPYPIISLLLCNLTLCCGTQQNRRNERILLNTNNIGFDGQILILEHEIHHLSRSVSCLKPVKLFFITKLTKICCLTFHVNSNWHFCLKPFTCSNLKRLVHMLLVHQNPVWLEERLRFFDFYFI